MLNALANYRESNCLPFPTVCFQKDFAFVKQEFTKVYVSSVHFLLHSPSLPPHRWADPSSEEQRARVIFATLNSLKQQQLTNSHTAGLEVYVDPTHQHLHFDISELTFDLLSVARSHTQWHQLENALWQISNVPKQHCSTYVPWERLCDWITCSVSLHLYL